MQNLRDKLLKAGKVTKKQRRKAEHQNRQKRRKGKAETTQEGEERRQSLYEAQLRDQRARDQALEAQRRAEREAKERDLRVRYIVDHYALRPRRGPQRWHYMGRDRVVRHLQLSDEEAHHLEHGRRAIVERPNARGDDAFAIVDDRTAELIWSIDDAYVRFYNRATDDHPARWWENFEVLAL